MLRVVLAVRTRIYRESLAEAIQRRTGASVAESDCFVDARSLVERTDPHLVLIDTELPGAADFARELRASRQVIALAIADVEADVISWAEIGVAAFVTAENTIAELVDCIVAVTRGEFACSPRHSATLLRHIGTLAAERGSEPAGDALTRRQVEILALLRQGLSNKLIARELGIEIATVKNHVHQILRRLHVERRDQAAAQHAESRRGLPSPSI